VHDGAQLNHAKLTQREPALNYHRVPEITCIGERTEKPLRTGAFGNRATILTL